MRHHDRTMLSGFGPDPADRPLVQLVRGVGRVYARAFHQLTVLSPPTLPATGPAILVCNHISSLDPVLIQSVCRRRIIWMMAREYYEIGAMRWGFKAMELIPVDRSGRDLAATRAALRALRTGRILGMFPEGRIETDHDFLPFQTGVGMLAYHARSDVYPAYINGTQRGKDMLSVFMESQRVTLTFGPPVGLYWQRQSRPDLRAVTGQISRSVEALRQATASVRENV